MESPLALYRRYRPETFAEVIGQDHVTTPLRAALANNRVNHAYLFSGPRGCGKTTSARILARALNCEQAPVADPCGECDSCRDLARGGPGSIDVIEIDAASHGGVDDARDLREKAFFAPVREPLQGLHHRRGPHGHDAGLQRPAQAGRGAAAAPAVHLRHDRARQGAPDDPVAHPPLPVPADPAAAAVVVPLRALREGGRDDRAGRAAARRARRRRVGPRHPVGARPAARRRRPEGVTHALATGLLGYTPDSLLDEVVDAFAAGDGAAVFGVVDKVIETGQDPRRFTEDLLRRLRDLVIVAAVPDAPATGLIDVSEDQGERLVAQAARFGKAELSRAADLVATGLTEMRGATAPRLLLELICARVLLPGADHSTDGLLARLDRLEKRAAITGGTPDPRRPAPPPADPAPRRPPGPGRPRPATRSPHAEPPARPPAADRAGADAAEPRPRRCRRPPPPRGRAHPGPRQPRLRRPRTPPPGPPGPLTLVDVRRLWPDIVEATKMRRRVAWMHLTQNCQVVARRGQRR